MRRRTGFYLLGGGGVLLACGGVAMLLASSEGNGRLIALNDPVKGMTAMTRAGNYLDLPAVSVPMGLTDGGLPAGLQIMGRMADEASVVALAAAYEAVSGWNGRRPDLSAF